MNALSGSVSNEGMTATRLMAGGVMSAATGVCFAMGFDFKVMLRIQKRNTNRERLIMCCAVKKLRATRNVYMNRLPKKPYRGSRPGGA